MPSGGFTTRKRRVQRLRIHRRLKKINSHLIAHGQITVHTLTEYKRRGGCAACKKEAK